MLVEVLFPALLERQILRATVAWRRAGRLRPEKLRAGLGVVFDDSEATKRDFILTVAGGAPSTVRRRHDRFPVDLLVDWYRPGQADRHPATARDIGAGGAFLELEDGLTVGDLLVVEVVPPGGARPLPVEGRVVWQRRSPAVGVGVQFRCRDTGGIHRLKELVRRFAAQADQKRAIASA